MNEFLARLRVFTIDLRSLVAFRIGLAALLLIDLAQRSQNLAAHYSSTGVLPLAAIPQDLLAQFGPSWIAIHRLSDHVWFQTVLFCAAAILAMCLLAGYRTRAATIVSWALLMSLHGRNPLILNGGDTLLRVLLFWSMFLPLGAVASVDAWRRGGKVERLSITNWATVALLLQVAMMYWFSSLLKRGDIWTSDYSATFYALSLSYFARPLGSHLLAYPRLLATLTAGTFWLEFVGPILAFCPVATRYVRGVIISLFLLFHLGLALTMDLGLFPFVSMVAWLPFVPAEFWMWLEPANARFRPAISAQSVTETEVRQLPMAVNLVVALLLAYTLLWNLRTLNFDYWEPKVLPRQCNIVGELTGLKQYWAMFAPRPPKEDGWYVMRGTLGNGEVVNLWQPDQPLVESRPDLASYQGWRWRKYLVNLTVPRNSVYRALLADWLAKRWNRLQATDERVKHVSRVELTWMRLSTPLPGEPPTPAFETQLLFREFTSTAGGKK